MTAVLTLVIVDSSTYITYRNSLDVTNLGITGALGRKGILALSNSGRRLRYASITAVTSNALLRWNSAFQCMISVVLYAYTPENFPKTEELVIL